MSRYKTYPEYRDSQSKWLGAIPSHWNLFDGKRVFSSRRELAREDDEQLAASQKYGVVPQRLMMEMNDAKVMLALKGTSSFRHVGENDFVISLRSFEGGIEHSSYVGCVSPAYTVLQTEKAVVPAYFKYLLKSGPYIAALQASTDSLRDGKSISYEQFGAIVLPYPVVDEQAAIAAFLDHEVAKIDALIEKQQRLIELLKEKRQAVISHAVTKGLNPNAPMKDSGVEWLGEVPAHWELSKIKYLCYVNDGNHGEEYPKETDYTTSDEGVPFIRGGNIQNFNITNNDMLYITKIKNDSMRKGRLAAGDVLFMNRGDIGKLALIPEEFSGANLNSQIAYLRCLNGRVNNEFLLYFLASAYTENLLLSMKMGSVLTQFPIGDLLEINVPLPSKEEQLKIANFIRNTESQMNFLLEKQQQQIQLMQERRTVLISAAVTGKIDVRDWQAVA